MCLIEVLLIRQYYDGLLNHKSCNKLYTNLQYEY